MVCTCPWKLVGRLRWWTFGPIVGPVWDFKLSERDICSMTIIFTTIHIHSLIKQPSGRSFPSIVEAHWYQFPFLRTCTLFVHSQVLLKFHNIVYLKTATATPSLLNNSVSSNKILYCNIKQCQDIVQPNISTILWYIIYISLVAAIIQYRLLIRPGGRHLMTCQPTASIPSFSAIIGH